MNIDLRRSIDPRAWSLGLALGMLTLGGCSSMGRSPDGETSQVFPTKDAPTMREIYERHFGRDQAPGSKASAVSGTPADPPRAALDAAKRPIDPPDYRCYTRDADNEIANLFPLLPNPTLVMYVYPHLASQGGYPVPGYSTAFKMYAVDRFALPGEVDATGPVPNRSGHDTGACKR